MVRFGSLVVVLSALLASGAATAADIASHRPAKDAPAMRSVLRFCPAGRQSAIATLPTLEAMSIQTNELYETSLAVYESDRTQYSRSVKIKWADLARITCGIASGYLSGGEVNVERLSDCECNYARMNRF